MKKIYILICILIFNSNCSLNKVIKHHGVHFLDVKEKELIIGETNKNDLLMILGPPSTKELFDKEVFIYIERKTSSSKITKLGKKELLINTVLVLELDERGILISKNLFDKEKINNVNFVKDITSMNHQKRSFLQGFLNSMRHKINDPLGKKRGN